tara:strand:+ start:802 stop:1677 length:876 start_codon:yes stop_codon:yes gene_type:complete
MKPFSKNPIKFTKKELFRLLKQFDKLYSKRPIKKNIGGMQYPHMFATYCFLKKIKPAHVIESGVYKGQSTWLIEKTLPKAKIFSIDIDLSKLKYKSKKAKYSTIDFSKQNIKQISKNSLVFFDDHQNSLDRVLQCKKFGIKHLIYEDNYAPGTGDCYSPKKILSNSGNIRKITLKDIIKMTKKILKETLKKYFNQNYVPNININELIWILKLDNITPNIKHKKTLLKNINIYQEFPPVFKTKRTRWNKDWNNENYPTEEPILDISKKDIYPTAYSEAMSYTWISYVKIKAN